MNNNQKDIEKRLDQQRQKTVDTINKHRKLVNNAKVSNYIKALDKLSNSDDVNKALDKLYLSFDKVLQNEDIEFLEGILDRFDCSKYHTSLSIALIILSFDELKDCDTRQRFFDKFKEHIQSTHNERESKAILMGLR